MAGRMMVRMPIRRAASVFSRMPPTGSTSPESVISPVIATSDRTGTPRAADTIAVAIVTPGRRAVLGDGAGRNVDVDVLLAQELRRDAEVARVLADVRERCARRLLHDASELAGQNDLTRAAGQERGFDVEDVAARFGPREPGRDAGPGRAERRFGPHLRRAEIVVHLLPSTRAVWRLSAATRAATLRAIAPIWRSSVRTPASRVYSPITRRSAASVSSICVGLKPFSSSWRGTRYLRAMWTFSSSV